MADIEEVIRLVPGKVKLNLHASYAIFEKGQKVDRDKMEPKHFQKWVDFAKKHHMGIQSDVFLSPLRRRGRNEPVQRG